MKYENFEQALNDPKIQNDFRKLITMEIIWEGMRGVTSVDHVRCLFSDHNKDVDDFMDTPDKDIGDVFRQGSTERLLKDVGHVRSVNPSRRGGVVHQWELTPKGEIVATMFFTGTPKGHRGRIYYDHVKKRVTSSKPHTEQGRLL